MFRGLRSLVAGLLAGTALGVLFSPEKGSKIRKSFKDELQKGGTGINTAKSTLKDMGIDIGDTAKDAYEDISETETYKAGKAKVGEYAGKAKKEGKKIYKRNVPAKTRKKIKKTVSDAKKTVRKARTVSKKASTKAKTAITKAKKKAKEISSKLKEE